MNKCSTDGYVGLGESLSVTLLLPLEQTGGLNHMRERNTACACCEWWERHLRWEQLNHSNRAEVFSCKRQVTSLQSRTSFSTAFFILSMVGGTSMSHRFSLDETWGCFSVLSVFLIQAAYMKFNKGQIFMCTRHVKNTRYTVFLVCT